MMCLKSQHVSTGWLDIKQYYTATIFTKTEYQSLTHYSALIEVKRVILLCAEPLLYVAYLRRGR